MIATAPNRTLVHADRRQYDFRPQADGTVTIVRRCGADVRTYPLPLEEARALYAGLRKQGFNPW